MASTVKGLWLVCIACTIGLSSLARTADSVRRPAYLNGSPIHALREPAEQFAFLIGRWRFEQLYPTDTQHEGGGFQDWSREPDGSLLGKTYVDLKDSVDGLYQDRLVVRNGSYMHLLTGPDLPTGGLPPMPLVQASEKSFVSVSSADHWPARTSYDLLQDGSIIGAIFVAEEGRYTLYRMTRR